KSDTQPKKQIENKQKSGRSKYATGICHISNFRSATPTTAQHHAPEHQVNPIDPLSRPLRKPANFSTTIWSVHSTTCDSCLLIRTFFYRSLKAFNIRTKVDIMQLHLDQQSFVYTSFSTLSLTLERWWRISRICQTTLTSSIHRLSAFKAGATTTLYIILVVLKGTRYQLFAGNKGVI
ncbi:unnamed protein product, partial [Brugia pahangi]|uniref:Ovule protein n=1 Tax=Brugia pahangi TaxID=6280 RepID=A0A0N4SYK0_BRUPA